MPMGLDLFHESRCPAANQDTSVQDGGVLLLPTAPWEPSILCREAQAFDTHISKSAYNKSLVHSSGPGPMHEVVTSDSDKKLKPERPEAPSLEQYFRGHLRLESDSLISLGNKGPFQQTGCLCTRARVSKLELTCCGGRRREPQPFRFQVFPAPLRNRGPPASAGVTTAARDRPGRDPVPTGLHWGFFPNRQCQPKPWPQLCCVLLLVIGSWSPAPPPAPGARTPEVRVGCSGEENPEGAALYFVSGVCIGLVLTLAALVMRISCHTDCCQHSQKFLKDQESSSNSSDSEDGSLDAASDISVRRHRRFERTLNKNVFTSVEELERAQRLEERERIIREIWMNGQPEVPGTRSLNRYY
nr:protein eva-1 homolog A [Bos taurus]